MNRLLVLADELRCNTKYLLSAIEYKQLDLADELIIVRLSLLEELTRLVAENTTDKHIVSKLAAELASYESIIVASLEAQKADIGALLVRIGLGNKAADAYGQCVKR